MKLFSFKPKVTAILTALKPWPDAIKEEKKKLLSVGKEGRNSSTLQPIILVVIWCSFLGKWRMGDECGDDGCSDDDKAKGNKTIGLLTKYLS